MSIKKFIMSGLALGTMLMASAPAHATDFDLGTLNVGTNKTQPVTSPNFSFDVFKFNHAGGELNLGVVNVTNGKKFRISLYQDTDKDGKYNPTKDTVVNRSQFGADNGDREIFSREPAATYFAIVTPVTSASATYTFIASNTGSQPSNVLADSVVLSTTNAQFNNFSLNDDHTSDFYQVSLFSGQQVSITTTPHNGQAQMRVIKDAVADRIVTPNYEIVNSSPASSQPQTLTVKGPGTYYLQVSQSVAGQTVATDVKFSP
jgi:hypothetical protein